jgi:hypothetical protein
MINECYKKLTFTEAANIAIKQGENDVNQLKRAITVLEETFPGIYDSIPSYERTRTNLTEEESYIKYEKGLTEYYAALDDVLEKLLERVKLIPLDYGYWITRTPRLYRFFICESIEKWNNERITTERGPGYIMEDLSVFMPTALYFAFPRYSGAILYMRHRCGSPTHPDLGLEIGLQVIDNYDAYAHASPERQKYATIPLVQFSEVTDFDKLAQSGRMGSNLFQMTHPFIAKLTELNTGYCEGVCKIIADIILNDYPDLFKRDWRK